MPWECLNCGNFNDDQIEDECLKCDMEKHQAMNMEVKVRKNQCPECQHMHRWGVLCHCYTEAEVDDDDEEEEEEEDDGDDDDDDDALGTTVKKKGPQAAVKRVDPDELPTPTFVKRIGYIRCNCKLGVPLSKRYNRLPPKIIIGNIKVKQASDVFQDLANANEKGKTSKLLSREEEEALEHFKIVKRKEMFTMMIPLWLQYLQPCYIAPMAIANHTFSNATNSYEPYVDVRNLVPWNVYKAHYGGIDSIFLHGIKAYTGGDKRINCSDTHSGETLATVTRDSGKIGKLNEMDGQLYASSSNGSVRTYTLSHNPSKIKLNRTLWDHSKQITSMMFGLATEGPCKLHGIIGHVCYLFTCSEDRYIKCWSLEKSKLAASITSTQLKNLSIKCMSQSQRHLYCGTTGSTVCVFTKYDVCERDDIHQCSVKGVNKSYCLQVSLKLPPMRMPSENPSFVNCLKCCGPNYTHTHLWAADSLGQLTVWFTPEEGLDFIPAKTWRGHNGAINAMETTWKHMISVADDSCIKIHDLGSLLCIRSINVNQWCEQILLKPNIPRKIKCLHIVENYEEGGQMVAGTNYGDVLVMTTGREV
jgi:WD40 repeat protein